MGSIGQEMPEYLVDFHLLVAAMREVGLEPLSDARLEELGLTGATGTFDTLFDDMMLFAANNKNNDGVPAAVRQALLMSAAEKRYSFLNRWFVFEKRV